LKAVSSRAAEKWAKFIKSIRKRTEGQSHDEVEGPTDGGGIAHANLADIKRERLGRVSEGDGALADRIDDAVEVNAVVISASEMSREGTHPTATTPTRALLSAGMKKANPVNSRKKDIIGNVVSSRKRLP
jgi:hypothetical protein